MKKLILAASIAAAVAGLSAPLQAATVNSNFTVSVTLDARCTANNSGTQTVNFGTYTAFGAAVTAPNVNLTFDCTRNLAAPTVGFDTGSAYGVLAGLNYQLTNGAPSKTTTGTAATAVAGGIGSADTWTVAVGGTMAANQAGDCAGGTQTSCNTATTATRTLILTY